MLHHPTTDHLRELGLVGMARALEEMRRQPDSAALDFEAVLDRLVHTAHRIEFKGESLRKLRAVTAARLDETAGS